MARVLRWISAATALAVILAPSCVYTIDVVVSGTASHAIPTTLFGQMFEDINSGDGGLYGELLQNRAFQQVTPNTAAALDPWSPVGAASISVIADSEPVSTALPNSLQVTIPAGAKGSVGFSNSGYWGIKVNSSWTYDASLFFRFPSDSSFRGKLVLALETTSGEVLASNSVSIAGSQTEWKQVQLSLRPTKMAANTNNLFVVTIESSSGSLPATTINFAMFSLFPPTFKNRTNGMRIDIAETLVEMGPSFFRFPGGNNLGQSTATRWQWNATVGPLVDRPGRVGDWGYVNTDGLGLLEYLTFFEDANMEPIMAVWSGYSLGGVSLPEDELEPYIQQAIDQINFVVGEPGTSAPATLRASLGHPEPFSLNFVEVGNEDFFASNTYPYRWRDFVGNLSAVFPNITFIATSYAFDPVISPNPQAYDVHVYQTPDWFAQNAFYYDSFERNVTKYFEGEYAAISTNASNLYGAVGTGRLAFPTMQSSSGEAAFMTGLERNSDIVFAASYAPLLQHVNDSQWTPDLISFDAGSVIRSTSFFTQKLFSVNRGDEYFPSTLPSPSGTIFWSVTRKTSTEELFIKIANSGSSSEVLSFQLPFGTVASTGTLQQLTGEETASNTPEQPNAVVPITSNIVTGKNFNFTAPAFSVNVITVKVH